MAAEPLRVARGLVIPATEIEERFSPSGGPGGQHANKTSTRVELRFDTRTSRALRGEKRARVVSRLGPVVTVTADDARSQARNRAIARERLAVRLADALKVETARRATRPGRGARERRLDVKRQQSQRKAGRRRPAPDD